MGRKKLQPNEILTIIGLKSRGFSNRKISRLMRRSISTISKYTNPRRKNKHWKPLPFNRKETLHVFPRLEEMEEVLNAEIDKAVYVLLSGYRPMKPLCEYKSHNEIHYEKIARLLKDPDGRAMGRLGYLRYLQLLPTAFS